MESLVGDGPNVQRAVEKTEVTKRLDRRHKPKGETEFPRASVGQLKGGRRYQDAIWTQKIAKIKQHQLKKFSSPCPESTTLLNSNS